MIYLIFDNPIQMDAPVPDDNAMRQWAREQMKDSRFMDLPADLLRLLICYVRDAAVEEHCATTYEIAKELVWSKIEPRVHACKCGTVFVVTNDDAYGGAYCSRYKCEMYGCDACMMKCDSCKIALCDEHTGVTDLQTCAFCKRTHCYICTADDQDCICSRCGRKLCSGCVEYIPTEGNAMVCNPKYGCTMLG